MEALSYCQLMERCLAAEARVVEAQWRIATQREYYEGVIADGGKRIAELESSTVNIENPQENAYRAGLTSGLIAGWSLGLTNNSDGFNKCLEAHAAGIKWEVE